jgi:hypothetical protein
MHTPQPVLDSSVDPSPVIRSMRDVGFPDILTQGRSLDEAQEIHENRGQNADFSNISKNCVLTPVFPKLLESCLCDHSAIIIPTSFLICQ